MSNIPAAVSQYEMRTLGAAPYQSAPIGISVVVASQHPSPLSGRA
jgi:hypothetical protein